MRLFNKVLVFLHRYGGIALGLLVMLWFASGIVMMYTGGMPALDQEARLAHRPALDFTKVKLSL